LVFNGLSVGFFRDGVSESQFNQVLNIELDQGDFIRFLHKFKQKKAWPDHHIHVYLCLLDHILVVEILIIYFLVFYGLSFGFFRDGVSESQFNQVLNIELDQGAFIRFLHEFKQKEA